MTDKKKLSRPLAVALSGFESEYMAARNLGDRSRVAYRKDAQDFLEYLQESGVSDLETVGPNHIQGYLAFMDRRKLAGAIRRKKFIVEGEFLKWAKTADIVSSNPALHIPPPIAEFNEARHLSEKEYRYLLSVVQKPRDRAIIQLLLQTGIRLAELQRLTLSDIELPSRIYKKRSDYSMGVARIQGKGRKNRTVLLNYVAVEALQEWLNVRPDIASSAVFVSNRRPPLSPRQIQYVVEKYMKLAGIKNASVHSLRRTFATSHLEADTDIKIVSELLGHSSLDITATGYQHIRRRRQEIQLTQNALK